MTGKCFVSESEQIVDDAIESFRYLIDSFDVAEQIKIARRHIWIQQLKKNNRKNKRKRRHQK